MSRLILPRQYVQMAKPVCFWYAAKLDHIMCPPSAVAPPPNGYRRIECRHAHEVDMWSNRLRAQEKRVREMSDEERYNYEEPIRAHMLAELTDLYRKATNPVNREFLDMSIRRIKAQRAKRLQEKVETMMHCEAKEDVAS